MGMFDWIEPLVDIAKIPLDFVAANQERQFQKGQQNAAQEFQLQMWNKNMEMQREFAKQGIRWRVADAEKAGLHPLAALGAMPQGFQPTSAVFNERSASPEGEPWRSMGQNISRAVAAMQTNVERRLGEAAVKKAELENALLEDQLKASRWRLANQNRNPGMPSSVQVVTDESGYPMVIPSSEMAEAMQGNFPLTYEWMATNRWMPAVRDTAVNLWRGIKTEAPMRLLDVPSQWRSKKWEEK